MFAFGVSESNRNALLQTEQNDIQKYEVLATT